jgi:hypothetical protein
MSISVLVVILLILGGVVFSVVWRNMQQQKRPRKRFKVGRARRTRAHPVYGKRISYTQVAREERAESPGSEHSSDPPPNTSG